jgi:PAS domain S-box-containing protein
MQCPTSSLAGASGSATILAKGAVMALIPTTGASFATNGEVTPEFLAILEVLPDGFLAINLDGKIVFDTSQAEEIFGYNHGDLLGEEIEMLLPERYRDAHLGQRATYQQDPQRRPMGRSGLLGLRKDGTEFPVEISLSPLETQSGVLSCAAVRDVTDRRHVEKALRISEAQVRLLLNSTAEAIYGLDVLGNCTFCNRACVEILGYESPQDLLGKNMHNLIHHTRADGTHYPIKECRIYSSFRLGVGITVNDEVLWRADGTSFPSEYRSFPIHTDGRTSGSVVTFLDITDQKEAEKELQAKQSELNHMARLSNLGEMSAGLAHELNQPLTAIAAYAEGALLRRKADTLTDADFELVCQRIAGDAQRAGEVIRRLRNFVQKRQSEPAPVDINRQVHEVCRIVESDALREQITVTTRLPDDLPEVMADPIEIQQVLLNLLRNAFDAISQNESVSRSVRIETRCGTDRDVEVRVIDTGPGLTPQQIEKVFEPFYSSKPDGLGIGLGICRSIIESYRGRIWVEPSLTGTVVCFNLPSA